MAVWQQRVDIAKLADELYEGSGMFCIPGTTSCGWQSWESNQCSFLVPLGRGARSGPNAQDTDQLAYQQRKDTQSACGGLGNTVAPQPSYDDFTSWAAAAVLGAQLQKWAASLQKYNSVISGTNPWDEAQQEYIAAGDGFQEGVDFLTVQGAEAPTAPPLPRQSPTSKASTTCCRASKLNLGRMCSSISRNRWCRTLLRNSRLRSSPGTLSCWGLRKPSCRSSSAPRCSPPPPWPS